MTHSHRVFAFFVMLLLLSGCANYMKRKECEKVNWFQHGQSVALKGQRPDSDQMVQECRKVDANIDESKLDRGFKQGMDDYCRPETVYQTGKNGKDFNSEFCSPEKLSRLRSEHRRGINEYCTSEGGLRIGSQGETYTGVCTPEQESVFMPSYKKGRKRYLETMISESERKLTENARDAREQERLMSNANFRLSALPTPRRIKERKYDDKRKKYVEEEKVIDPYSRERDGLNHEISRYRSSISSLGTQRQALNEQITNYKKELVQVAE